MCSLCTVYELGYVGCALLEFRTDILDTLSNVLELLLVVFRICDMPTSEHVILNGMCEMGIPTELLLTTY